jgi:hypothetical protein
MVDNMKADWDEVKAKVEAEMAADAKLVQELLDKGDFLDDDGYPTDDALTIIEKWSWDDKKGWFDFIHEIWHLASWGWSEGEQTDEWDTDKLLYQYDISTAGWSGNESIIRAMEANTHFMWGLTWVQSRRGGHYIFQRDIEELK